MTPRIAGNHAAIYVPLFMVHCISDLIHHRISATVWSSRFGLGQLCIITGQPKEACSPAQQAISIGRERSDRGVLVAFDLDRAATLRMSDFIAPPEFDTKRVLSPILVIQVQSNQ